MIDESLRAKVVKEAHRNAAAYVREFRALVGADPPEWVIAAWAALKRDFKLAPKAAKELWPVYWEAFSQETNRIAWSLAGESTDAGEG
jgi:hypothetical protein